MQSTCGELASAPDDFTVNHGGTSNVGGEEQKIQAPANGHLLYSHVLLDFCDGNDGNDSNDGSSMVQMWKHQLRLVELKTRQLCLKGPFTFKSLLVPSQFTSVDQPCL